jgi:hypothetical protein
MTGHDMTYRVMIRMTSFICMGRHICSITWHGLALRGANAK